MSADDRAAWLRDRYHSSLAAVTDASTRATATDTAADPGPAFHANIRDLLFQAVHVVAVKAAIDHLRDGGTLDTLHHALLAAAPTRCTDETEDVFEARRRAYACEAITILRHCRPDLFDAAPEAVLA